jgi:hypothetical protein
MWNFLHCLSALNGRYVEIGAPRKGRAPHYNYKKSSLDAQYTRRSRFATDIGAHGKTSDGGNLTNSNFGEGLERGKLHAS